MIQYNGVINYYKQIAVKKNTCSFDQMIISIILPDAVSLLPLHVCINCVLKTLFNAFLVPL